MSEVELTCKVIANHYGYPAQSLQLTEECAELIQAVNKYRRAHTPEEKQEAFENYVEEIADVEIMLEQIKYLIGVTNEAVDDIKLYKVRRTVGRFN